MRGLFTVAAATMYLLCSLVTDAETDDFTHVPQRVRICVTGRHETGIMPCAKCVLKAGTDNLERNCRDFATPKKALKYWDKYCCD